MTEAAFDAPDFEPIVHSRKVQSISRPSLSYWQDAWIRLKANTRALISLYIVIGLMAFTILGPVLWRVDPALQDLDQISIPPGTDRQATLVAPFRPWDGTTLLEVTGGLRLAETATTQSVRLLWDPVEGSSGYRIYRNLFPVGPERALGLPLAENFSAQDVAFEDRLDLVPGRYYYSVLGVDESGEEVGYLETLEVDVFRVITLEEATLRGWVDDTANLQIGDAVTLGLHPLGTDYLGRDMLARLMYGARVSLFIGICAPFIYVLFGVMYGSAAGFVGGRFDQILMRFADFVVALPFLLFMILFKIVFDIGPGEIGIIAASLPMLTALVVLSWPATARLVRGQILQIRQEAYISASQLLGAKTNYLVLRHMIPNTMGVILVTLTFAVPSAIFTEAFLSFIGMGVSPPTPSWGSMCNEGIKTMLTHPHELIFPALLISTTVLAFNLLGDGLRDALDARMRSTE
ncbi:MAG: ABC transporter permease [Gammaproteobacteria bacterium]|nr:ABC transporter permease [Gammaproteobacteria bacterium]